MSYDLCISCSITVLSCIEGRIGDDTQEAAEKLSKTALTIAEKLIAAVKDKKAVLEK